MSLWVPPKVSQELQQQTQAHQVELLEMVHRKGVMDDFNRDLKRIDSYLELIWAPGNARAPGLIPNRYHVLRHNPGAPPTLLPIVGPDGEYVEPNSGVFDLLREQDMWSSEASYDRKRRERAAEDTEKRRKAREDEQRREELEERWKAATRTQVLLSPDVRWSQNASGRRGRS